MNKWVLTRILIISIGVVLSVFAGAEKMHTNPPMTMEDLLLILFGTPLTVVFVIGIQAFNKKSDKVWKRPSWSLNPFSFKQPLQFFYLASFFFLVGGTVIFVITLFGDREYIYEALVPLATGGGLYAGVYLSVLLFGKRKSISSHK